MRTSTIKAFEGKSAGKYPYKDAVDERVGEIMQALADAGVLERLRVFGMDGDEQADQQLAPTATAPYSRHAQRHPGKAACTCPGAAWKRS